MKPNNAGKNKWLRAQTLNKKFNFISTLLVLRRALSPYPSRFSLRLRLNDVFDISHRLHPAKCFL